MADRHILTPEVLRQLLRYEAETGKLFWRKRGPEWFRPKQRSPIWEANRWNAKYAGKEAGSVASDGYCRLSMPLYGRFYAHRAAFAIVNGFIPRVCDHIDGNPKNNRIKNLRDVSQKENIRNARKWSHNTSGVNGVAKTGNGKRWRARIKVDGIQKHIGTFDTRSDATEARRKAEHQYGFTKRHGR